MQVDLKVGDVPIEVAAQNVGLNLLAINWVALWAAISPAFDLSKINWAGLWAAISPAFAANPVPAPTVGPTPKH